jgi:hypothetical protein
MDGRGRNGGRLPGSLVMRDFDELIEGVDWNDAISL